jgi:hypothetical protein
VAGVSSAVGSVHRPAVRFGLLAIAGIGTVVGSVVICERADEAASTASLAELELLQGQSPTVPTERIKASTDRGTRLVLKEPTAPRDGAELSGAEGRILKTSNLSEFVIRRGSADDRSNCHGWVFTGGQFFVSGEDVDVILKENGYYEHREPQPGDLVVYRADNAVTHTAVVRYVSEGQPVLLESKWGKLGVFLHPADKSPYGAEYTFYRSPRKGHQLASASDGQPASPAVE